MRRSSYCAIACRCCRRLEGAERGKRPGRSYLTELIGGQNRVTANVVDLVSPVTRVTHDHDGRATAGGDGFGVMVRGKP